VLDDEFLGAEELVAFSTSVLAFVFFLHVRLGDVDELVVGRFAENELNLDSSWR
jgi:hypothetical protein